MIFPSKIFSFKESIFSKMTYILENMNFEKTEIIKFYLLNSNYFENIDEFIYSLDLLYLLEKIEVDFNKGVFWKC